jgi:uncharacterized membrane protein (DUF373 family)
METLDRLPEIRTRRHPRAHGAHCDRDRVRTLEPDGEILLSIVSSGGFDPTDYSVFQALFGMIFTVIIALEFKRSLLVIAERRRGIVQVRTVVLIALLAIVRKLMIIDLTASNAAEVFALAAAILALGAVYWLVRDQDRREQA